MLGSVHEQASKEVAAGFEHDLFEDPYVHKRVGVSKYKSQSTSLQSEPSFLLFPHTQMPPVHPPAGFQVPYAHMLIFTRGPAIVLTSIVFRISMRIRLFEESAMIRASPEGVKATPEGSRSLAVTLVPS